MPEADKRTQDQEKATRWLRYVRAGMRAKREYMRMRKETLAYFRGRHPVYEDPKVKAGFMDFDQCGVGISVNKPAEIRAVLGARLYQQNPTRVVHAKSMDPVMQAKAQVIQAYGNWSMRECNFGPEAKRSIDGGLMGGSGFMRSGVEQVRKAITSWYFSDACVVYDPAALHERDASWIALKSRMPVWKAKERFRVEGQGWRLKGLKGNCSSLTAASEEDEPDAQEEQAAEDDKAYHRDLITVWEVYSKIGAGLRRGPEVEDEDANEQNPFVKLVVADGHEVPLYEGPWECPLYLDNLWPVSRWNPIDPIDELWGQSIFGQAVGLAKTIDLTTSMRLWLCRAVARQLFVVAPDVLEDIQRNKLTSGNLTEVLELNSMPPNVSAADVLARLDVGEISDEIALERQWATEEYEKQTGVTSILHGGQESGGQDRSATATDARQRAANARLNDLVDRVEGLLTDVARTEAILLCLGKYVSVEQVTAACGELEGELGWRPRIMSAGNTEMPLRDRSTPEERQSRRDRGVLPPLTVEELVPEAANYFQTQEAAMVAAQAVAMEIQKLGKDLVDDPAGMLLEEGEERDYRPMQYLLVPPEVYTEVGAMQPDGLVVDASAREVTVADVLEDSANMTPEEVMREFSFEIETGTTQKLDPLAMQERANNLILNVMPQALSMGDIDFANQILRMSDEAAGIPAAKRLRGFVPPPMPAAPPAGGEPPAEGPPAGEA